jgi:energy-converting hydrogenase Eha subunit E
LQLCPDPLCAVCCLLCPGALLSLCLLAQVYDHTLDLITHMATLPLGAEVLVQVRAVSCCRCPRCSANLPVLQ